MSEITDNIKGIPVEITLLRSKLLDLLAVIHRDGGEHTSEVGIADSVVDAIEAWGRLRQAVDERDALALECDDAWTFIEERAGDYDDEGRAEFAAWVDNHVHRDEIAEFAARLAAERKAGAVAMMDYLSREMDAAEGPPSACDIARVRLKVKKGEVVV